MAEWSKALAWKVSIRHKRIEGSNPSRSATTALYGPRKTPRNLLQNLRNQRFFRPAEFHVVRHLPAKCVGKFGMRCDGKAHRSQGPGIERARVIFRRRRPVCDDRIERPSNAHLILVTGLYEGGETMDDGMGQDGTARRRACSVEPDPAALQETAALCFLNVTRQASRGLSRVLLPIRQKQDFRAFTPKSREAMTCLPTPTLGPIDIQQSQIMAAAG